jgi:hypothetical protein
MSAAYAWLITKDHITEPGDDLPSRVGWQGPHDAPAGLLERLNDGDGLTFRMKDDDGEVYYEGRYLGPDDEDMFGPLDDLGRPDAGAVDIQYREHGKWVSL